MSIGRRLAACAVAAILGAGCGSIGADGGPAASRETIAPLGRALTLEGTVTRIVSGHVLVVDDGRHEIVVVVEDAVPEEVVGGVVEVRGRIRDFATEDLERTLGIDLADPLVSEFLGLPCVVADDIETEAS